MSNVTIQPHVVYREHHEAVEKIAWSFDSQYIASVGSKGNVHIWDPCIGKTLSLYENREGAIRSLTWLPQEHIFAIGDENGYIKIFDVVQGNVLAKYAIHNDSVSALSWSPSGRTIISACSEDLHLWEPNSGQDYWKRTDNEAEHINTCTWSSESNLIATCNGSKTIPIWNISDGEYIQILSSIGDVRSIAWSPDGTRIAYAGWGIELWDVYSGNLIKTLGMRHMIVQQAQWSPDSKYLAACFHFPAQHEICVFEAETGRQVAGYSKHKGKVLAISWASNGQEIASASTDGTAHLWNIASHLHLSIKN